MCVCENLDGNALSIVLHRDCVAIDRDFDVFHSLIALFVVRSIHQDFIENLHIHTHVF